MAYRVEITPEAEADLAHAYLYICAQSSHERAAAWYNQLRGAVATLQAYPGRCPLAPEDRAFSEEIRQLIHRPYRILFSIVGNKVVILRVRHGAQQALE